MPYAEINDAMTDPEFLDTSLTCVRTTNVVGTNGLTAGTTSSFKFSGVITTNAGIDLDRTDSGSRLTGSIAIVTRTLLTAGNPQYGADVITWLGRQYTVRHVDDYSTYGRGFYQVLADLLPLTG